VGSRGTLLKKGVRNQHKTYSEMGDEDKREMRNKKLAYNNRKEMDSGGQRGFLIDITGENKLKGGEKISLIILFWIRNGERSVAEKRIIKW